MNSAQDFAEHMQKKAEQKKVAGNALLRAQGMRNTPDLSQLIQDANELSGVEFAGQWGQGAVGSSVYYAAAPQNAMTYNAATLTASAAGR